MKSGLFSSSPVKVYKDKTLPPECPVTLCHRDAQTDDSLLDALLQERLSIPEIDSGRGSTLNDQDAIDMLTNGNLNSTFHNFFNIQWIWDMSIMNIYWKSSSISDNWCYDMLVNNNLRTTTYHNFTQHSMILLFIHWSMSIWLSYTTAFHNFTKIKDVLFFWRDQFISNYKWQ